MKMGIVFVVSMLSLFLNACVSGTQYSEEFNARIVQVDEEPNHHLVLQSKLIRVFDAYFPSKKASLFHSHNKDSIFICLDGGNVTNELLGEKIIQRPPIESGFIYFRPYSIEPLVHRIKNISPTPFRILDIELLTNSPNIAALAPIPSMFNIVIENEQFRVSKLLLAPSQSTEMVTYLSPRYLVMRSAGKISLQSELQSRIIDATIGSIDMEEQRHTEILTNIGDSTIEVVILELKEVVMQ